MTKYNKSEIMKNAWNLFKGNKKVAEAYRLSFAECLHRAWEKAKYAVKVDNKLNGRVVVNDKYSPITMTKNFEEWAVSGKTFAWKKILKDLGFSWDCENKTWYTNNKDVARSFVRAYAA